MKTIRPAHGRAFGFGDNVLSCEPLFWLIATPDPRVFTVAIERRFCRNWNGHYVTKFQFA
jgi:hypothetical protein